MAALAAILADAALEPTFIAQALTPPSEADIAREIGHDVDPDAIFAAAPSCEPRSATGSAQRLADTYDRMTTPGPIAGCRKHRPPVAQERLPRSPGGDPASAAIARAVSQYASADNMTDRMAALDVGIEQPAERVAALEDFYRRYADDPLIIDKWFALQAAIPEPDTLERVRTLTAHPAFSMANPNRVRSLIGNFAQANQTQFNRVDGAGYAFLADTMLALDPKNPQVAARLMSAFRSWRALEPRRRERAEATLRRVAAAPTLSRDLHDILARTLADS